MSLPARESLLSTKSCRSGCLLSAITDLALTNSPCNDPASVSPRQGDDVLPTRSPVPASRASHGGRLLALDQLRGFVVVLVVLHHALLAYCTFGHVDRLHYALSTAPIVDARRWIGFDFAVTLNDGFFMPLLFLLSGLFVRDSLARKKPMRFLSGRLLRLGLPFVVAELLVIPLAYYPSFLQAGGAPGFQAFWMQTVTVGPWPSGPPWFITVLLLFDIAATLLRIPPRRNLSVPDGSGVVRPGRCFGVLLVVSLLVYLPSLIVFGPTRWLSVGPVAVQASRILLYAAYFAAGVTLGAGGTGGLRRFGEATALHWAGWAALAFLTSAAFLAIRPLLAAASGGPSGRTELIFGGLALATYCAAASFALLALFLRFGGRPGPFWTSLAANGFVIDLLHYPVVTWVQYALLPFPVGALVKGPITFGIALVTSWVGAVLLRRSSGLARVIP